MSDILDELREAVFDALDTGEVRYIISSTPIGPVMFGSDGSMKYGDNLSENVPPALRGAARLSLAAQFKQSLKATHHG